MKQKFFVPGFFLCAFFAGAKAVEAAEVRIGIDNVFLPTEGYDDNDTIQIMLDGQLPNACYDLGRSVVQVNETERLIQIEQYANVSETGDCADQSRLPQARSLPRSFESEVRTKRIVNREEVNTLPAGEWRLRFQRQGQAVEKVFQVGRATDPSVQNEVNYAIVTNVNVEPAVSGGELSNGVLTCRDRVKITIFGFLQNSCVSLASDLASAPALAQGTLVLRPKANFSAAAACLQVIRPYNKPVELDALPIGRYMAHVRSASGLGVNRLFSVVAPTDGRSCPQ